MGILMTESSVITIKVDRKFKPYTQPDLKPDSTIYGMRNDTTKDARKILFDVVEKDYQLSIIAKKLYDDVYSFFAGDMDKNIKKVNKDNVSRILDHYHLMAKGVTLTEDICDEWITNETKKEYITQIEQALKERAKDLNIGVDDLDKKYKEALTAAFQGWPAKIFGYINNSNIKKIDDVFNEYYKRITEKEITLRSGLFNKPFTDKEVEKFLSNDNNPRIIGNPEYNRYKKELANNTILSKGIGFTGKIEYPSQQQGGSCVMHASVNALVQNEKGAHLVNRLFRIIKDSDNETYEMVCIPEAVRNKSYYYPLSAEEAKETLAVQASFGDGDMAALIHSYANYVRSSGREYAQIHLGFEALSGEKAQVFLPNEPIPMGVGVTKGNMIKVRTIKGYLTYANILYENMKDMLDKGNGAAVYTMKTAGFFNNNLGKYIKDMETEELTDEDAFIDDSHAYSIVKLTDKYAYLQESNNPHLYIKLKKETFIKRMQEVATWKYA